jgi:hypothetical protein
MVAAGTPTINLDHLEAGLAARVRQVGEDHDTSRMLTLRM